MNLSHFLCGLFRGHAYVWRKVRDRETREVLEVFGECLHCGHTSDGWRLAK